MGLAYTTRQIKYVIIVGQFFLVANALGQIPDSLQKLQVHYEAQASFWALFNSENHLNTWLGARYIPKVNLGKPLPKNQLLDIELSANFFGSLGTRPFDTLQMDVDIRPYRAWMRYTAPQWEVRVGLQKINFGTANLLRPLRWFDQIDPRDPLQITEGVWGVLGRYYFLNNTNIWLWGLYPTNRKGWEILRSSQKMPELGARLQCPSPNGEIGMSYHYREAEPSLLFTTLKVAIPEHRIGWDMKFDRILGFWLEGNWIYKTKKIGILRHQLRTTIGADYTFDIGSGLNVVLEHLLSSSSAKAFEFQNPTSLSAFSMNYPLGLFDRVNAIIYYDWINKALYNYIQWQHNFSNFDLNVIAFWNPQNIVLPQQEQATTNLFAGKGIQILAVYNY